MEKYNQYGILSACSFVIVCTVLLLVIACTHEKWAAFAVVGLFVFLIAESLTITADIKNHNKEIAQACVSEEYELVINSEVVDVSDTVKLALLLLDGDNVDLNINTDSKVAEITITY